MRISLLVAGFVISETNPDGLAAFSSSSYWLTFWSRIWLSSNVVHVMMVLKPVCVKESEYLQGRIKLKCSRFSLVFCTRFKWSCSFRVRFKNLQPCQRYWLLFQQIILLYSSLLQKKKTISKEKDFGNLKWISQYI